PNSDASRRRPARPRGARLAGMDTCPNTVQARIGALDWPALETALDARGAAAKPEWSPDELYVSLPRPGGDAWLSIDLQSGELEYERTDRGWIAYLNDLHKGRHTGLAWSWFLDIFAVACLVFSLTGLVLLKMHAGNRAATWPMVGLGVVIPVVLALLFIH
ncbi:PepSY-associated TM helix domain-containing protein, partial [Bordetella pertussis]